MNALKVIYFGTPDFAVEGLHKILDSDHDVVGVVTSPDKPSGRGQRVVESPVKKIAKTLGNIRLFQPKNLKSDKFLNDIRRLEADIFVVVAFRMLPKEVWEIPRCGTFNLHASLLPDYRGAAPINQAIINGEKYTGVTTFFIDEKIDTGDIILQEKTTIELCDTAGTIHDKLMILGGDLITKTIDLIARGKPTTTPQVNSSKKAPKIFKDHCQINWTQPLNHIYNFVRGLSPYPAARSVLENGEDVLSIKIYKTTPVFINHDHKIGRVIVQEKKLLVTVSEGFLSLDTLQLPNKKPLYAVDFINGYTFHPNCKVQCP